MDNQNCYCPCAEQENKVKLNPIVEATFTNGRKMRGYIKVVNGNAFIVPVKENFAWGASEGTDFNMSDADLSKLLADL